MKTLLSILLVPTICFGLDLTANWTYPDDGNVPEGYKIYTAADSSMTDAIEVQQIPGGDKRTHQFAYTPSGDVCFGISAYNSWGESSITPGSCLGKPSPVGSLSISVELSANGG